MIQIRIKVISRIRIRIRIKRVWISNTASKDASMFPGREGARGLLEGTKKRGDGGEGYVFLHFLKTAQVRGKRFTCSAKGPPYIKCHYVFPKWKSRIFSITLLTWNLYKIRVLFYEGTVTEDLYYTNTMIPSTRIKPKIGDQFFIRWNPCRPHR